MFEEEAKEWVKKEFPLLDMEHSKLEMITEYRAYKEGAKYGYNKANEWHYVKSGDLPAEDTRVLALMAGGEVCIAHFYRKNVWDKIGIVIAWKEIILP